MSICLVYLLDNDKGVWSKKCTPFFAAINHTFGGDRQETITQVFDAMHINGIAEAESLGKDPTRIAVLEPCSLVSRLPLLRGLSCPYEHLVQLRLSKKKKKKG